MACMPLHAEHCICQHCSLKASATREVIWRSPGLCLYRDAFSFAYEMGEDPVANAGKIFEWPAAMVKRGRHSSFEQADFAALKFLDTLFKLLNVVLRKPNQLE